MYYVLAEANPYQGFPQRVYSIYNQSHIRIATYDDMEEADRLSNAMNKGRRDLRDLQYTARGEGIRVFSFFCVFINKWE